VGEVKKVLVPDIGDFKDVPVIEVLVKVGDRLAIDDALITLESDKASIEVPSPYSGVVNQIHVKAGDKVSEGSAIITIELSEAVERSTLSSQSEGVDRPPASSVSSDNGGSIVAPVTNNIQSEAKALSQVRPQQPSSLILNHNSDTKPHAGPSVRRFARELGVDLSQVVGSGLKHRILKEDILAYVKHELSKPSSINRGGLDLLPWPHVDFAKFGPIELKSLSRIKQISGANLHRNWVMIPHVTQFDEADITELESLRKEHNESQAANGAKLTILAFLIKATTAAL